MSLWSYLSNLPSADWLTRIALSGLAAYFSGGVLAGAVWCQDCGANPLSRLLVGIVMGFLSALTGGFPPANEGGVGESLNAWPFIVFCWVVTLGAWLVFDYLRHRQG